MFKLCVFMIAMLGTFSLYANEPNENTLIELNESAQNKTKVQTEVQLNENVKVQQDTVFTDTDTDNSIVYGMPVTEKSIDKADIPTKESMISQIGVGLFIIIGIIFGLSWLAKKVGLNQFAHKEGFKILNTLPLGGKEKVVLIDVNGEHVLLGVAPGSVNYIKSINSSNKDKDTHFNESEASENENNGLSSGEKKTIEQCLQDNNETTKKEAHPEDTSSRFADLLQQHKKSNKNAHMPANVVVDFSSYLKKMLLRKNK